MPKKSAFAKQNLRGFTLIELLIVITIIGILSAIGLVAYSYVMKQGRDSKRQSDLRAIQAALEQYYTDQGFYPTLNSTAPPLGLNEALNRVPPVSFTNRIGYPCTLSAGDCPTEKIYINSLPQDPTGVDPYQYETLPYYSGSLCRNSSTDKCTSYCLYAKLENPPYPAMTPPSGCTFPAGYNFFLTPP